MPQPKMGSGPWGDAIRYWLNTRQMRQADLLRKVHEANPDETITANTISNAARGLHCNTRTLAQIARALDVSLDEVLVSPDRQVGNEERRRMALEIAQDVLREMDQRRDPLRASFAAAEAAAKQLEANAAAKAREAIKMRTGSKGKRRKR